MRDTLKQCEVNWISLFIGRYEGPDNHYEGILEYMEDLFRAQDENTESGHEIHIYHTCATDTENIQKIHASVQGIILRGILNSVGAG